MANYVIGQGWVDEPGAPAAPPPPREKPLTAPKHFVVGAGAPGPPQKPAIFDALKPIEQPAPWQTPWLKPPAQTQAPATDPDVRAIEEYKQAQQGKLTGPLAPPPTEVKPSAFQPADVVAGAALGAKAGLALPGIARTAAEVGAIGPTQEAARPLTEKLPESVGMLDLEFNPRFIAEQAIGFAPGLASEALAAKLGRSIFPPRVEPIAPPGGPGGPPPGGPGGPRPPDVGPSAVRMPPSYPTYPVELPPPPPERQPVYPADIPFRPWSEEPGIPLTEAAARTVRPPSIGEPPPLTEAGKQLAGAKQTSIYGKAPERLTVPGEQKELEKAGLRADAKMLGVDELIRTRAHQGRPINAIAREVEHQLKGQMPPGWSATDMVSRFVEQEGLPSLSRPATLRNPVSGRPIYQRDAATGEAQPITHTDVGKPPEPPEANPNGTMGFGGPPSLADGRTPFDPNVPTTMSREKAFWHRLWSLWRHGVTEKLPREAAIVRNIPQSPVISTTERFQARLTDDLAELVDNPMWRAVAPEDWINSEARAVERLNAGASEEEAMREFPQAIQDYIRARQSRMAEEQAARETLGLPEMPEYPFPYLPRRSTNVGKDVIRVFSHGGFERDLRTSIGQYAQERTFRTMRDGMAQGVEYDDPRIAAMMREWAGLRLRKTAQFVRELEGKTLFRTAEEARAASPTGEVTALGDFIPGGRRWWTTNRDEAIFIKHQFQSEKSSLGSLTHYANALFRNPNLFNPIPHFTKNMGSKFILAGGNPLRLGPDVVEFMRGSNPELLARFNEVMPYSKTGLTSHEILADEIAKLSPSALKRWTHTFGKWITKPTQLSSKALFKWGDPAMRYSLWKKHLRSGMTDQEAANHAWVDLIRYSTRSEMVDFWKAIPTNFFVPWRWGTLTSLLKQSANRPVRTALVLGAIDYAREAGYRKTGWWFHLPWDYAYGPVAQMLQDPKSAGYIIPSTIMFGPGGAFAASQLSHILREGFGSGQWGRLQNMFWGISQLMEMPKEWQEYQRTKDPSHLVKILASGILGAHEATRYEPVRLSAGIPRSLPGMGWNPDVASQLPIPQLSQDVSNEVRRLGVDPHYRTQVNIRGRQLDMPPPVAEKFAQIRGQYATRAVETLLGSPNYRKFDTATQKKIITTQFKKARQAALNQLRPEIAQMLKDDSLKREPQPKVSPPPVP